MTDSLSIAVHAFASGMLMSDSVDETLLPRQVNLSTSFKELPFRPEMSPRWLKRSQGGLRLVPDYVAGFLPGWVYLQEAVYHRPSTRP